MTNNYRNSITPRFQALLELPSRRLSYSLDIAMAVFLFLALTGTPVHAAVEDDPFEKVNRLTYGFNTGFDRAVMKPLASGYERYAPKPAQAGIRNFFNNLDDLSAGVNDLLQLKLSQAAKDFARFAINSTVGVAGVFDVAQPVFALKKNSQDFGKTLAHWGVGSGPYVVLPFIGPSTARDALGIGVYASVDPIPSIDHVASRNSLLAAKTTDRRADFLSFDELVIGDEYLFVRGIYLQAREYAIQGEYPELAFDEF